MAQFRQLAVIMFTDIVGYTALMGKDTAKALELIKVSKEIQKPLVLQYGGEWLKEMGDGVLAKFSTALDAINCALKIQEMARAKLDGKLRIGIHLGDVTVENNDVYGDGVNVASRLESIADPGGIYISDSVEKSIRGQSDIQAKYLGELRLKNVEYGVRTYAIQGPGLPIPAVSENKNLTGKFWAELQRRSVIRVAISYVVIALLILLLTGQLSASVIPPLWREILFLMVAIGFPLALYLAWNFERSPKGFVRTTSEEAWQNPYSSSQRKPLTGNILIVVMAIIIAVMYFNPDFLGTSKKGSNTTEISRQSQKSIAVLPFKNLSSNAENDYFCAGVMESILDRLAQVKGLKVISRTSVEQYKNTAKSSSEIGEELNVRNILEGGVLRDNNNVRIFARLISAESNEQLWSRTFDRQLTDIFSIQSEISKSISDELNIELSLQENTQLDHEVTKNLSAYDDYLRGREYLIKFRNDLDRISYENALKNYNSALQRDSSIAPAYVDIAATYWIDYSTVLGSLDRSHLNDIKILCEKALAIDPTLPQAHYLLGLYYLDNQDGARFIEEENKAIEINGSFAPAYSTLGNYYSSGPIGEFEKGIRLINKALELDPYSADTPTYCRRLTHAYLNINAFDRAEYFAQKEKALGGTPDFNYVVHTLMMQGKFKEAQTEAEAWKAKSSIAFRHLAEIETANGNYDRAIELFEEFKKLNPNVGHNNQRFGLACWLGGEKEKGRELLENALKEYEAKKGNLTYNFCYDVAGIYATLGNTKRALEILGDNACHLSVGLEYYSEYDPFFKDLWDNPEFKKIIRQRKEEKRLIREKILRDEQQD